MTVLQCCNLARSALLVLAAGLTAAALPAGAAAVPRVIVLGFDGMDHALVERLIAEGRLPNLARLAREGRFAPLGTSVPPLSPVAWSDFITGMDAGGHGIFDFIHRDPRTMIPYLSTSRTEVEDTPFKFGKYQICPLAKTELLRYGKPFWEVLEERGVETTVLRIPANFPPSGAASRELSGMGTPDILGTYGTFAFYTSKLFAFAGEEVSGGEVFEVDAFDNVVEADLYGPANCWLVDGAKLKAPFTVYIDPVEPAARLVVGEEERILQVGEWSDWVPVEFETVWFDPGGPLHAMARFYLKAVRP